MAQQASSSKTHRAPLFGLVRKVVDATTDLVDDLVERGEGVERDARRLAENALRERDKDKDKDKDGDRGHAKASHDAS